MPNPFRHLNLRPPWQKGQPSPNPKGRPKKPKPLPAVTWTPPKPTLPPVRPVDHNAALRKAEAVYKQAQLDASNALHAAMADAATIVDWAARSAAERAADARYQQALRDAADIHNKAKQDALDAAEARAPKLIEDVVHGLPLQSAEIRSAFRKLLEK